MVAEADDMYICEELWQELSSVPGDARDVNNYAIPVCCGLRTVDH